jgi:hypothetical protein
MVVLMLERRHPAGGTRASLRAHSSLSILLDQISIGHFVFVCLAKFVLHVKFKVRLGDSL